MHYQLVAIDLDGTLLNDQHRISPANHAAVRACLEAGVRVVIATGRLFNATQPYCVELGLSGPVITLNGAAIADSLTGTLRDGPTLPWPTVDLIRERLQQRGVSFIAYSRSAMYGLPDGDYRYLIEQYGEAPPHPVDAIDPAHVPPVAKMLAFLQVGELEQQLRAELDAYTEIVRTDRMFLEFLIPGVSKGSALTTLMAEFGVPRERVLAIGDSFNDLSMFAVAGMSVAMGDAHPDVQAHARTLTEPCGADGVAAALERFVLRR